MRDRRRVRVLQIVGWLSSTWTGEEERPRTLVDEGVTVVADLLATATSEDAPSVPALLGAARWQVALWAATDDVRITAARAAHLSTPHYGLSQLQRITGVVANSLVAQCQTVAIFFSLYSVNTRRWVAVLMMVTALLAMLMVQVWLMWSMADVCCGEARVALGCERSDAARARPRPPRARACGG